MANTWMLDQGNIINDEYPHQQSSQKERHTIRLTNTVYYRFSLFLSGIDVCVCALQEWQCNKWNSVKLVVSISTFWTTYWRNNYNVKQKFQLIVTCVSCWSNIDCQIGFCLTYLIKSCVFFVTYFSISLYSMGFHKYALCISRTDYTSM
jgi:hypothetical protein